MYNADYLATSYLLYPSVLTDIQVVYGRLPVELRLTSGFRRMTGNPESVPAAPQIVCLDGGGILHGPSSPPNQQ